MSSLDLAHGNLTTTISTIVTSSTDIRTISHATFYNAHTSAVNVTVYYMRSGQTSGSAGVLKAKKAIPPGKTWICYELIGQVIEKLGFIQSVADVTAVIHYNLSGTT